MEIKAGGVEEEEDLNLSNSRDIYILKAAKEVEKLSNSKSLEIILE